VAASKIATEPVPAVVRLVELLQGRTLKIRREFTSHVQICAPEVEAAIAGPMQELISVAQNQPNVLRKKRLCL
jgi:hypothetical protein